MSLADRIARIEERLRPSRRFVIKRQLLDLAGTVQEIAWGGDQPAISDWIGPDGERRPWAERPRPAATSKAYLGDDTPPSPRESWQDGR